MAELADLLGRPGTIDFPLRVDTLLAYEQAQFLQWRSDILQLDKGREKVLEDEVTARFRRVVGDGWTPLGAAAKSEGIHKPAGQRRLDVVESMTRFIFENGHTC